jgi:uncharacterized protein (DUF2141 family)
MSPESTSSARRERRRDWLKSQWASNHISFLLVFVGATILVNVLAVAYQQWKFVPLKFPDARAFKNSDESQESKLSAEQAIEIRVIGAPSMTGNIVVCVSDYQAGFEAPHRARRKQTAVIKEGEAVWRVDPIQLPESFAVTAFHDEDGNGRITLNSYGIPLERYGYSGEQRFIEPGVPPTFERVKIDRPPRGDTINLFIR